MRIISKPNPDEYPEYSHVYIGLIEDDGKVLEHLWQNFNALKQFVYGLSEEQLSYRYAEGKWTIKEILVHLIDDERIYSYRALRFARNDKTILHGFEEKDFAMSSDANNRSLESIFDEYEAVRKSTIALFQYLPEDSFIRSGASRDRGSQSTDERTVRAVVYHIAGHELRHLNIIKERYIV